jgi:hypothetical protein
MALISETTTLYIGSTPVSKAYLGAQQVWPVITGGGGGGTLTTPSFTSITVANDKVTHSFTLVSGATTYRIETEKVG